jgi:hypothetical protein
MFVCEGNPDPPIQATLHIAKVISTVFSFREIRALDLCQTYFSQVLTHCDTFDLSNEDSRHSLLQDLNVIVVENLKSAFYPKFLDQNISTGIKLNISYFL